MKSNNLGKRTLTNIAMIFALATTVTTVACAPATTETPTKTPTFTPTPLPTATPTPLQTATPTIYISKENNPFVSDLEYEVEDSFQIFENEPVEDLGGMVIDSYLGQMTVYARDNTTAVRPFSWLVFKDRQGEKRYLIYPAERIFPKNARTNIKRYWPIKEDVILMNNMLVYLTNMDYDKVYYWPQFDFPIESSAEDKHIDGIIDYKAGIEFIEPEVEVSD